MRDLVLYDDYLPIFLNNNIFESYSFIEKSLNINR